MASIWQTKNSKTQGPLNQKGKVPTVKKAVPAKTVPSNSTPTVGLYDPVFTSPGFASGGNTSSSGIPNINFDLYKTQSASIADISKKYGIDYSREYAARQAEAEAQAKRSGLKGQQKQVDEGVRNAQDALSRDYFQRGLAQAQANVNGGINAGLANESNLRLSMNRQGEMGEIMGQANLARNQIAQQLTDVETARIAMEEQIYNERLQQAIAVIQQDRSLDQNEKQALMNAMLQQRAQNIDMDQFNRQMEWDKYTFGNVSATDQAQLDWSKYQFNNISAEAQEQSRLAWAQLEQEKAQFATEHQWRVYQYNNMSASERAQLDENKRQFGEEMAWRQYELEYTSEMALAEASAGLDFLP